MTEIEQRVAFARFEYLTLLKAGLKEWLIDDERERKRLESILRAVDKYCDLLADELNEERKLIGEQVKENMR